MREAAAKEASRSKGESQNAGDAEKEEASEAKQKMLGRARAKDVDRERRGHQDRTKTSSGSSCVLAVEPLQVLLPRFPSLCLFEEKEGRGERKRKGDGEA